MTCVLQPTHTQSVVKALTTAIHISFHTMCIAVVKALTTVVKTLTSVVKALTTAVKALTSVVEALTTVVKALTTVVKAFTTVVKAFTTAYTSLLTCLFSYIHVFLDISKDGRTAHMLKTHMYMKLHMYI